MTNRDSFEFWAELCRENTGSHFLDSGSIYGYQYQRPLAEEDADALTCHLWDGKLEYVTISLAHWLHNELDASDPVAEALETLLYWLAENRYDEREPWGTIIEEFVPSVNGLLDTNTGPQEALAVLDEHGILPGDLEATGGGYTYNSENEFDQDWVYDLLQVSDYEQHVIIRTHNGCDARGGFSSPVVAAVNDPGYLWDWYVGYYCPKCDAQYEMSYYYGEALGKCDAARMIESYASTLAWIAEREGDQLAMGGIDAPQLPDGITEELAAEIVAYHRETGQIPVALSEDGHPIGKKDEMQEVPSWLVRLLCPKCGRYSVVTSNSGAYGF